MNDRYRSDADLFDASDVEYDIKPSKKRNEIDIRLKSESDFNLLKIYLSLMSICQKIETELNIMEDAEGEH